MEIMYIDDARMIEILTPFIEDGEICARCFRDNCDCWYGDGEDITSSCCESECVQCESNFEVWKEDCSMERTLRSLPY